MNECYQKQKRTCCCCCTLDLGIKFVGAYLIFETCLYPIAGLLETEDIVQSAVMFFAILPTVICFIVSMCKKENLNARIAWLITFVIYCIVSFSFMVHDLST